jgi:4-hydroxybenzoate polyprenyltransferase
MVVLNLLKRLNEYYLLMRMDRPIGTFLLLWPTLWALWIAGGGQPRPLVVTVFVLGVFLMRSAGCVINDYADRHLDPHVARTRERPVAAGRVPPKEALILFVALCTIAFVLVLSMNRLTIQLSFVGAVLAVSYPFTKRVTHLPQFYLGAAFSWSIPMAFAAQTGAVPGVAWWLVGANLLWVVAYDTMYAMVDREDDIRVGAKSTAILFGHRDRLVIGLLQLAALVLLIAVGRQQHLGGYYYGGLAWAAGHALYQQGLIRRRERQPCFRAFLNNAWFGAAVFIGLVLDYLARAAG